MDKFYAVYLSVIIVGKQTCVIPRDLRYTPSMAAYKMIRLKFELACKSSIANILAMSTAAKALVVPLYSFKFKKSLTSYKIKNQATCI